jgi:glyoxylase-like metal-dependent hydrolase (beta-lactamase superfamily II)
MLGIRPADVDTVILTHAHPDHIGVATPHRQPIFRNARHILAEREFEFWTGRADLGGMRVPDEIKASTVGTARRSLEAIRFQIETVDGEREVVPGVWVLPAPGHTPGHQALLISDSGQHLLNVGDAAVHPLHLQDPTLENGFDLIPQEAGAVRTELLERAVAEGMHMLPFHFPFPSVGRVTARQMGGWDWAPGW